MQAFVVSWKISDSEFISRGVVRSAFGSLITREMSDFRSNLSFAVPTGTQTWPARSLCLVDYAHTQHPLILLVLNCYCEKSTDIQRRSSHHRILLLQVLSRKWVSKFKEKYISWAGESFVLSCSHRPSVPWCSPWSPLWGQNPPVPGEGWCFLHGKAIYQSRRVRFHIHCHRSSAPMANLNVVPQWEQIWASSSWCRRSQRFPVIMDWFQERDKRWNISEPANSSSKANRNLKMYQWQFISVTFLTLLSSTHLN